MKIRQSFAFGALWCIGRVLHLCIRHVSTCSNYDESKPFKASSILMSVAYMGKLMSLDDMDQDNHTAMIVHTIFHEYAPTSIALSAYPHYKVKSNHDLQRVIRITMRVHHTNCTVTHTRASVCAHTRTHTQSRKVK